MKGVPSPCNILHYFLWELWDLDINMHEVSIMTSAMKIITEKAYENNASKVKNITIKIGELSGAMPEALKFAFGVVSKGTIAEGAVFNIERVKATAECNDCKYIFEINHFNKLCPKCEKFSNNILTGYELNIDTMEVE